MKNKKTYYQLILDKSGSMASCANEAINNFNEQVQMIQDLQSKFEDQEFYISCCTFNHEVDTLMNKELAGACKLINANSYRPNGSTALLDAIGDSINSLKKSIGKEVEKNEASVVVVIITDGYENASSKYTYPLIREMISELESTEKWTFSFLGAEINAVEEAAKLNIQSQNAHWFDKASYADVSIKMRESFEEYAADKSLGKIRKNFFRNK